MTRKTLQNFVVCVANDEHPVDLELRKIYCTLPDRQARRHGLIRVIDESGEDYLFPAEYFVPLSLPQRVRARLGFEPRRSNSGDAKQAKRPRKKLSSARDRAHAPIFR